MISVAFGTVVFEAALPYMPEFLDSVNSQTFGDFSLLIVSEGLTLSQQEEIRKQCRKSLYFKEVPANNPVHQNRIELLKLAKENMFDLLVLGDSDDLFSHDRVELIVRAFDSDTVFYFNALSDFQGNPVFEHLDQTASRQSIIDKNYLGMSNTAINITRLSSDFLGSLQAGKTKVFDWYLFARILEEHSGGTYVPQALTRYRIHANNMVGAPSAHLKRDYQVKEEHYRLMAQVNPEFKEYLSALKKRRLNPNMGKYWWDSFLVLNSNSNSK